jgi:small subunit ribosomal protein S16
MSGYYIKEVNVMSVKIRLNRMGAKKNPFYRIVVADSRSPRDGRFIEILGQYDSTKSPAAFQLDEDKAIDWLRKGAHPTDTVRTLFSQAGILKKWDELKRAKKEV